MIRSGFKSRVFDPTSKPVVKIKLRKCAVKGCATRFEKRSMTHRACSPECAAVLAKMDREKAERKAAKIERSNTLARKEAIKTIPQLKAEAEKVCHAYIRERDKDKPCICCDKWPKSAGSLRGGAWDAAHYRGRGSADHLRYDEDNIHRALKDCNKYGHTNYRAGLIKRIGVERVEALEADQTVVKWTREMLIEIRATYKRKLKELRAKEIA